MILSSCFFLINSLLTFTHFFQLLSIDFGRILKLNFVGRTDRSGREIFREISRMKLYEILLTNKPGYVKI